LENEPVVEVSRSDMKKRRFNGYETGLSLIPCGSIAYKLARCAAGQSDSTLSVTPKNEWDIAAGVILVQEGQGASDRFGGSDLCLQSRGYFGERCDCRIKGRPWGD
jgi:fructose-1,6-bisphosphatase/inositol monophosphatase family enzyme